MAKTDYSSMRGEAFVLGGTVTKPPGGPGYPVGSPTGFRLTFTAKRKRSDAAPVVTRNSVDDGALVTLAAGGAWTVKIQAADTSGFTHAELLYYEVVLLEGDGTMTVVDYGVWRVSTR